MTTQDDFATAAALYEDLTRENAELQARITELEAALRQVERNAHGGYLMGGSYVNPCGCDRIARRALSTQEEQGG